MSPDKIIDEVINQSGIALQLLKTRKYQTYDEGDGEYKKLLWEKFSLKIDSRQNMLHTFRFGCPTIAKLFLADNKKDYVVVFLGYNFTKLYLVSENRTSVSEVGEINKEVYDTQPAVKIYIQRKIALSVLPSYDTLVYSTSNDWIARYKNKLGENTIPITLALLADDFDRNDFDLREHRWGHSHPGVPYCSDYHSIAGRALRVLMALNVDDETLTNAIKKILSSILLKSYIGTLSPKYPPNFNGVWYDTDFYGVGAIRDLGKQGVPYLRRLLNDDNQTIREFVQYVLTYESGGFL